MGTLAMDAVWYRRYRRAGGDGGFLSWELATSTSSFDQVSAPGKVGKKLSDAVGIDLPDESAGLTTNVVHWLTGVGYGVGHAVLQDGRGVRGGVATGTGAFATSYAMLGALGIYEPIWRYDRETLLEDLSAHLVFGVVTGLAYRLLSPRARGAFAGRR